MNLILIDHEAQKVNASAAAAQIIEEALAIGALIGQVRDADENQEAVKAQQALKSVEKQIEEAYRAAKDPIVKLGRRLDETYRALLKDIQPEYGRIGSLAAQYALAEKRRVEAERIAARETLEKLEREKHEALTATNDPLRHSEILENFSRRAAQEIQLPSAPNRAGGQKVREEWEIEVLDLIQFARWVFMSGHWECLGLEVKKMAVKEMLEGGMKEIPGLKCLKIAKAGVTLPRSQKPIDV
jgi:hypothetical protein